jgi:hypothetical protein
MRTPFGVSDLPSRVAFNSYAERNSYWDADTTRRNATGELERFGFRVSVGHGSKLALALLSEDRNCRDSTLRLKITEEGDTLNADTNLNSLTPWLPSARLLVLANRARRTTALSRCFVATPGRKMG